MYTHIYIHTYMYAHIYTFVHTHIKYACMYVCVGNNFLTSLLLSNKMLSPRKVTILEI